jgi:hypothetical protein
LFIAKYNLGPAENDSSIKAATIMDWCEEQMDNNTSSIDIRVLHGEKVPCPNCGEILIYQNIEDGKHPSIICINGDYNVF